MSDRFRAIADVRAAGGSRVIMFGSSQTSLEQFHYFAVVLRVTGGTTGNTLSSLTIGGVEVLSAPVVWATSNAATAALLIDAITANGWSASTGGTNFVLATNTLAAGANGPSAGYWGQGGPVVRGVATGTFQVSVFEGHSDRGWFGWANALAGMPMTLVNNAGISGGSHQLISDRMDDAIRTTPADIAILNLLGRVTPPSATNSFALTRPLIDKLRRYGMRILIVAQPPGLPSGLANAAGSAEICKFGRLIEEFARYDNDGDIDFIQLGLDFIDQAHATAGTLKVAYHAADTLHFNNIGGYLAGKDCFNAWLSRRPLNPRQLSHSLADAPNVSATSLQRLPSGVGLFQGTGGTLNTESTGALADGWTDVTTAGTNVYSQAARTFAANGDNCGNNQIVTHTNSGTGADFVSITTDSFHTSLAAGDSVYADAEIKYAITSGSGLRNVALVLTIVEGPIAHVMHAGGTWGGFFGSGADLNAIPEGYTVTRRTPIIESLPVAPTSATLAVQMWAHNTAGVSVATIARAGVHRVET